MLTDPGEGELPAGSGADPMMARAEDNAGGYDDDDDEGYGDEEEEHTTVLDKIMEATALPRNIDSFFMTAAEGAQMAVLSKERAIGTPKNLESMCAQVDEWDLFKRLVNQGNLLEIAAELARQQGQSGGNGYAKWSRCAELILKIANDNRFHALRCHILQPFTGGKTDNYYTAIEKTKQHISEMATKIFRSETQISWDALSFKIPAHGCEFFSQKNPQLAERLTYDAFQLIDQVEKMCVDAIGEKCNEYRGRTDTREDEFIQDQTLYLESMCAGISSNDDRRMRVEKVGYGVLVEYLDKMQPVFTTGNLPCAVQPSKIYACHDIVSAAELKGSIVKLSEGQVMQQSAILENPNLMKNAQLLKSAETVKGEYTATQRASIMLRRNVDSLSRVAFATMGENYDQPMARLENQLAGGANTLAQQLESRTTDAVVTLNQEQKEIVKQQLSILLACLRLRAQAIQSSAWELMTSDDLDHMEIVRFMAHQTSDIATGYDGIYRQATSLQATFGEGHNKRKFSQTQFPDGLAQLVTYTLKGRAKVLLKSLPFIDEDLKGSGHLFEQLFACILMSLAQRQRNSLEQEERTARRTTADQAQYS